MKRTNFASFLCCGVSALVVLPTSSFAQTPHVENDAGVNTIVVTATKRAENIQDVPLSVSAISGDIIESRGIQDVADLAKFVPSLRVIQSNSVRHSGVLIRGVGGSGTNQGIEPSVGIFLDGVYLPIPGPIQSNLSDVSSVEVLRGPQGTLYGRNTPVGAVNINTRAPTHDAEAALTARYGNYEDLHLSGYLGGGLSTTLAGRVSFWASNRNGYEANLATGKDINSLDQFGVRTRLKWEPSDKFTGNFIAYYTRLGIAGTMRTVVMKEAAQPGSDSAMFQILTTGNPYE